MGTYDNLLLLPTTESRRTDLRNLVEFHCALPMADHGDANTMRAYAPGPTLLYSIPNAIPREGGGKARKVLKYMRLCLLQRRRRRSLEASNWRVSFQKAQFAPPPTALLPRASWLLSARRHKCLSMATLYGRGR